MPDEVAARLYARMMAALADFQYRRLPVRALRVSGRQLVEVGSALLTMALSQPIPKANRVYNLGVGPPATRVEVDAIVAEYQSRRLPYRIELSPLAQPDFVDDWIRAAGGRAVANVHVLSRARAPIADAPTSLRIESVTTKHADDFLEPYMEGFDAPATVEMTLRTYFEVPGARFYAAYDGSTPAAGAWMFVHDGVAYFTGAATREGYRGRGAQSALLARRIGDAQEMGCELCFIDTDEELPGRPNPSFHNVVRAGFEPAFLLRVFEGGP